MDKITELQRSKNMSRIKGSNTSIEKSVRSALYKNHIGYRKNVKEMPGKPDIVCSRYKAVIFVNGCFWHGHDECKLFVIPKTRTEWWLVKIIRNKTNDVKNAFLLTTSGWRVFTVWQCQLKKEAESTLRNLIAQIKS